MKSMSSGKNNRMVLSIVMMVAGLMYLFPFFFLITNSFKSYAEILTSFSSFPKDLNWGNFVKVYEILNYPRVFLNTLILSGGAVVGTVLVSFIAAYAINRLDNKLSNFIYLLFVFGLIIPFHSIMIPLSRMITSLGLMNNYLAIIALYIGFYTPFGIFVFSGFLRSISKEIEEAAKMDGCNLFALLFRILFPLVAPATSTLAVLFCLWTWNDFLLPMLMIDHAEWRTLTLNQYVFIGNVRTEWNLFIASLLLSIVPVVAIYIAAQRYIVDGLTAGAVK
ncbi:carbohydrate ABC transporter permease [Paenibacillus elgii]